MIVKVTKAHPVFVSVSADIWESQEDAFDEGYAEGYWQAWCDSMTGTGAWDTNSPDRGDG